MTEGRDAGYQALQQGDVQTAIARLEQAAQQPPEDYLTHLYLGAAYGQAGRHAEAVQALTKAVQLDPANAQARYNLGIALERAGWREQAVMALQQALQLQPDYQKAKDALHRVIPPPIVTVPAVTPPPVVQPAAMAGGYGPAGVYPSMPPLYTTPCRLCGALLAYGRTKCPRCEAPLGMIADPNNAIPSYVPIGGYASTAPAEGVGKAFPPEVESLNWNWGAFGLGGIWCFGHGMPGWGLFVLLCYGLGFVPIYQVLFIPIYILVCVHLGVRGNKFAWQHRRYSSVAQFTQIERKWGHWGMGFSVLFLLPLVLVSVMALTR